MIIILLAIGLAMGAAVLFPQSPEDLLALSRVGEGLPADDFASQSMALEQQGSQAPETELIFVFEINRHGARAPLKELKEKVKRKSGQNNTITNFNVRPAMLTSSGMRQRYLMGRLNRERYVYLYGFLSPTYKQEEVEIVSTDFYRTLQSAYAQLSGTFPDAVGFVVGNKTNETESLPSSSLLTLSENQLISITDQKDKKKQATVLPFKLRRFNDLQDNQLLDQSTKDGFLAVPVFTQMRDFLGCKAARAKSSKIKKLDSTFVPHLDLVKKLRDPVGKIFKLSKKKRGRMSFNQLSFYCDQLVAQQFEGIQNSLTVEQQRLVQEVNKWGILQPMMNNPQHDVLPLYASNLLKGPIKTLQGKVEAIKSNKPPIGPKYQMISAHDTQIAYLWQFLNPVHFSQSLQLAQPSIKVKSSSNWFTIPYASSIVIELHQKKGCTAAASNDCFLVGFASNGQPLKFKGLKPVMESTSTSTSTLSSSKAAIVEMDLRLKQGLYNYDEAMAYLKSISYKREGFSSSFSLVCQSPRAFEERQALLDYFSSEWEEMI